MTNKEKLLKIRQLLKEAYDHYFTNCQDCGCKSGEGHISLEFGDYWSDENCECKIKGVTIGSYVFGPHRMHYYDSLDEALKEVMKWHQEEMQTVYTIDDYGYPTSYLENPDFEK
jgi:hypothetical protein